MLLRLLSRIAAGKPSPASADTIPAEPYWSNRSASTLNTLHQARMSASMVR
jgi:hypothetical protein